VKRTLGIDEAGRGPVLGPMVLAAVVVDPRGAARLTRRGVRDSKAYGAGPAARGLRSQLAAEITAVAVHTETVVVEVEVIDARVARGELNQLEREIASDLIRRAPGVERIICDGGRMFAPLRAVFPALEAIDRAELAHCAVAAASILAKVTRDALFAAIADRYREEFGELHGNGYVNRPTRAFIRRYAERYSALPPEARRSWPHPGLEQVARLGDAPARSLATPGQSARSSSSPSSDSAQ
jgi:ribonuclease HII